MGQINASDFVGYYQKEVDLVDKIWWYFYSVTIVMLSFITICDTILENKSNVLMIVAGYTIFSIGSAISLKNGQQKLHILANQAYQMNNDINLNAFSTFKVVALQIAIAVAVVSTTLAILYLEI